MPQTSRYFSSLESTTKCMDEEMFQLKKKKKLHIGLSSLFCINIFVSNDTIPNLSWCNYDQNWIPRMAWYSPTSLTVRRCCGRCKIHFDFHWSLWWLITHKKLLRRNGKVTTKSQIPRAARNASPREELSPGNMFKSMLGGSNYSERHLNLQER